MINHYAHLDKPFKKRYHNSCLSNLYLDQQNLEQVYNWIKKKEHMLIFLGCPGCGKTQCSTAIYNWLVDHGKYVRYIEWNRLIGDLRHAYSVKMTDQHVLHRYLDIDYLIIDDIKAEGIGDWHQNILFDLIDGRWSSELPTFISSNIKCENMEGVFGERVASRMFDTDNIIIQDWDNDHRQQYKG